MALDTNDYNGYTASQTERISNPLFARQTPGSMTLVRPAAAKLIWRLARALIRDGKRGRFFNVVELVDQLEAEGRAGRQGVMADFSVGRTSSAR